ncbi:hypothetical protein [Clostridium botulinum]|uniref:hypothetical protein n=1 Tax=Clostridium botulinum TaxID=1491 RepID=UPI001FD6FB59|nr:hypothetical protein [Clostridium botulinum]MCJ8172685.1 hypothetical protein [Clostridium botulinum]
MKNNGYDGWESLLREYLQLEMRNQKLFKKDYFTEIIQRQKIISLLYKPLKDIEGLKKVQLDKTMEMFPLLNKIFEILEPFKNILKMKND